MITNTKKIVANLVAGAAIGLFGITAHAQEATTLDQLLEQVRQGSTGDAQVQREREARFQRERQNQANLLAEAKRVQAQEEARSSRLERQYEENEATIVAKRQQRTEQLGVLEELFGTVQGVAGDTRQNLVGSLVSAQYPGRVEILDRLIDKIAGNTQLPTIEELEQLWYFMQQEMTQAGEVERFRTTVVTPDGTRNEQEVVRVGTFNILSDGKYLTFEQGTNTLLVLPRQPAGRYTSAAADLQAANSGLVAFGLDPTGPTGGSLLLALIDTPDLVEQWHQGRQVGYVITALGIIALTIAIWRLIALSIVGSKVNAQLRNVAQPSSNNPLGRVLLVSKENPNADTETLELKLHEAVLKETPKLEAWVSFIKIVSMVAPLLGLLGTVTGMILTFQALTLFGTGDPKTMAGGISAALVTTVLGLMVAIPTVFLHALVNGRSKKIVHVLEEQAAGIIAEQSEQKQ